MMLQTQGNHRFHAANAIEFNKNVQKEDVNTVEALANLGIGHSSQSLRNYKPNIHKWCLTACIEKLSKQLLMALQKISALEELTK